MDTENPMAICTSSHWTRIESELGELTSRIGAANTTKAKTSVSGSQKFGRGELTLKNKYSEVDYPCYEIMICFVKGFMVECQ